MFKGSTKSFQFSLAYIDKTAPLDLISNQKLGRQLLLSGTRLYSASFAALSSTYPKNSGTSRKSAKNLQQVLEKGFNLFSIAVEIKKYQRCLDCEV